MAVTSAFFQSSGSTPVSKDLLKSKHSGVASSLLSSCSTRAGTLSGPWAFLPSSFFKRSSTAFGVILTSVRKISLDLDPSRRCGTFDVSSLVKTLEKNELSVVALSASAVHNFPCSLMSGPIPVFDFVRLWTYFQNALGSILLLSAIFLSCFLRARFITFLQWFLILTRWGQHLECTFGKNILAWFHNLLVHIKTFTKQKSRSDIFDRYFKMFPYCPIGP